MQAVTCRNSEIIKKKRVYPLRDPKSGFIFAVPFDRGVCQKGLKSKSDGVLKCGQKLAFRDNRKFIDRLDKEHNETDLRKIWIIGAR